VRILIMSDTHVPTRARQLPAQLWRAVESADLVVHAGDWVDATLLDELIDRGAAIIGVYGNNDGPDLRDRLPKIARVTVAGVRTAVVHETGPRDGRETRVQRAFPDVDLLIFGHSHIPWDTTTPEGLRMLNPGSPTDRRRQPFGTYLTAVLDDGTVRSVEWHEIRPPA
jgi:putative phosphoesterase